MRKISTLCIASLLLFAACGETEPTPTAKVQINNTELAAEQEFEESEDFAFVPPPPLEIAQFFRMAGLPFDQANLNPISNKENYQTKFKKSVNFGVYSSDVAVCVVNDQIDIAQNYLNVIEELAGEIGMNNVISEELANKFRNNMQNQDSIVDVLITVQDNLNTYIYENGKDDLQAIYYAGAWIEGMYMGALTLKQQDQQNVVQQLASQIELGIKIAKGLEAIEDQDPEIKEIRQEILKVVNEYNTCESILNTTELDKDLGRISLTQDELDKISGLIIELRNEIIQ